MGSNASLCSSMVIHDSDAADEEADENSNQVRDRENSRVTSIKMNHTDHGALSDLVRHTTFLQFAVIALPYTRP